ncbi:sulfurtransferase [Pseudactinotalea suaedae]|jgi:thiosulfate/3-mercaptopyruvate sulfurtransferase|uniref:sulfurtransferase n=1 Tax=Pseudactinotalea suaedae TaxID=1524924 RepID=UPI0012E1A297|nr:sulfurtransferase [Pseudactinotalea suaedae]
MTQESMRKAVLVDAEELRTLLVEEPRLVLLDVRWSLADPDGHRAYCLGHLPGALFVDLDHDLSSTPTTEQGRHPLPDLEDLQAAARRWGIDDGDPVIVYDDSGGTSAARAWWLLRWGGLSDVRILDGGLQAWIADGGLLEDGDVQVSPGSVVLTPGHMPVAEADDVATLPAHGVLIDARAGERYVGDVEPIDTRAGHVPGAVNIPTTDNLREDQTFKSDEELADQFAAAGVEKETEVAVYCGSGVTATHEIAALETIGVHAALYPGSWSQWSADDARPVATGIERPTA